MKFLALIGLVLAGPAAPAEGGDGKVGTASVGSTSPALDRTTARDILDKLHDATGPINGPALITLINDLKSKYSVTPDTLIQLVTVATASAPKAPKAPKR